MHPHALSLLRVSPLICVIALGSCFSAEPADDSRTDFGSQPVSDSAEELPSRMASLGGPATIRETSPDAFGYPSPVLSAKERRGFQVGNSFFKQNWVAAPASTTARDGLGPFFNARSCSACHFKDGRGRPPENDEDIVTGFLIRLGRRTDGPDQPHETYGGQLQDRSIHTTEPEARFRIEHEDVEIDAGGGHLLTLSRPSYRFFDTRFGPIDEHTTLGPRTAPQVIGLGLLEAIPTESITGRADPDDADGDGISGRAHFVTNSNGESVLGRFGWKATKPTVLEQSAGAFVGDMGITSSLHPMESLTETQLKTTDRASGGDPEINDRQLGRVAFYSQMLAVPAQRDADDPEVLRGERVFEAIGCSACHTSLQRSGREAVVEAYANTAFRPYTDLLVHDMGEELADGKRDGDVHPNEWRTPPLWGIGLFETVNGHTRYLHDGRARNLEEAILWHGGEGRRSRLRYLDSSPEDRAALLRFLRSL